MIINKPMKFSIGTIVIRIAGGTASVSVAWARHRSLSIDLITSISLNKSSKCSVSLSSFSVSLQLLHHVGKTNLSIPFRE